LTAAERGVKMALTITYYRSVGVLEGWSIGVLELGGLDII
jgi:hypothetical protein